MRPRLFSYLEKIGLFEYLKEHVDYWAQGTPQERWDRLFKDLDSSLSSGIQVTQACTCAILRKNKKVEVRSQSIRPSRGFKTSMDAYSEVLELANG